MKKTTMIFLLALSSCVEPFPDYEKPCEDSTGTSGGEDESGTGACEAKDKEEGSP